MTEEVWNAALRMGGVEDEFLDLGEEEDSGRKEASGSGNHIDLLAQIGDGQQIM